MIVIANITHQIDTHQSDIPNGLTHIHHQISTKTIQFTKSSIPTKLYTEGDPGKADFKAHTFYHQFQAYASQYKIGLKPLADLGPDVDDYYQPSFYGMTTQEMEIECTANSRALAPKIVHAVDDQMTINWLSSMMTTITDGYEIMKELM